MNKFLYICICTSIYTTDTATAIPQIEQISQFQSIASLEGKIEIKEKTKLISSSKQRHSKVLDHLHRVLSGGIDSFISLTPFLGEAVLETGKNILEDLSDGSLNGRKGLEAVNYAEPFFNFFKKVSNDESIKGKISSIFKDKEISIKKGVRNIEKDLNSPNIIFANKELLKKTKNIHAYGSLNDIRAGIRL